MIPGWVLPGELPMSALPDADSQATASPERLFLEDPDAEHTFLLELTPTGGSMLRLSDRGFITTASDSPASTPYRDRLLEPYNVDVRIPAPDEAGTVVELAFGLVEIESGDEDLDSFLAQSSEGATATIKVGGRYHVNRSSQGSLTFAQYQVVECGTVSAVGWNTGRVILSLRERLQKLQTPIQTSKYSGTGGLNGTEQIKDQPRPLAFGQVFNVEPVLVVPATQIYEWSTGEVDAVLAIRDKGILLTAAGDVGDIVAAAPPAPGTYITQNSAARVRLGALPEEGRITLDGRGDKTGGIYVSEAGAVAQRIAERVGLVAADFESSSFSGFPSTGPVGLYLRSDPVTALQAIELVLSGVWAWISQSRAGLLRIGRYLNPAVKGPEVTITDDVILNLEEGTERPPVWRVEVEYAPNWTPQDRDGLSDALSVEERDLYAEPFKLASAQDTAVQTAHADARVYRIASLLRNSTDATALALVMLETLKQRVRVYRVDVERQMFRRQPNAVVAVVSADSDLASGRNLLLLSVAEDASTRVNRWELWG